MSLRVIHCAETIKGGIATYLRELLPLQRETFGANGVAVVVPTSQLPELPVPEGVRLVQFDDTHGRVGSALALARKVVSLCRNQQSVIVHVHSTFAGVSVRLALAAFGRHVRIVYCPHGWAWDRPMSPLGRGLTRGVERVLAHLCDSVVCISEYEYRAALESGLPESQLRVVLNGIASHGATPSGDAPSWPAGKWRLLFVGRFDHQKGVDLFCQALSRLGTTASGILAGEAVLASGKNLKLPENAVSVGWLTPSELEFLFSSADVLVVPSRWEGFGLIAAEAMRAGLPVIATRVGGLAEVVIDGETGFLIEPNNVDAIVRAIGRLDSDVLARYGAAARIRVAELFTIDRVHRQLCELYGLAQRS